MKNVTCQDKLQAAEQAYQAALDAWSASAFDDSEAVHRVAAASEVVYQCIADLSHETKFSDPVSEALAIADQLDAALETGAAPDLIVSAAASLRLLCCLLDVDGAEHGGAHPRSGGAPARAALAAPPHGNHGDNLQ